MGVITVDNDPPKLQVLLGWKYQLKDLEPLEDYDTKTEKKVTNHEDGNYNKSTKYNLVKGLGQNTQIVLFRAYSWIFCSFIFDNICQSVGV
jgi:hypothetical protein